ncbi:MAG: transposase [Bacteroidales bacterium]|jgi:transposase|nr:transposase [Bacteroidales bacterium]
MELFSLQKTFFELTQDQKRIVALEQRVQFLINRVEELEKENALLKKELSYYRTKRTSSNSSVPPSQDPYRLKRTESLREQSGLKPGGQFGHVGSCLEMVLEPTEIVEHHPHYCQCCGKELSNEVSEFIGKRQVIDIPPIKPIVREDRIYGKRCSCGHITESAPNFIKGKNAWAWVFQTPKATYIHSDTSRSKAVINQLFPQGFSETILVHDCWASYFGVQAKGHQICTAHLLRELKYLSKLYPQQKWSKDFTSLLGQALELKKNMTYVDYLQPVKKRTNIEKQLELLLQQTINPKYQKLVVFKERIIRYRNYLFSFLYNQHVPPDNNASERAARTFKVKQKVSGLFRSTEGAEAFAIIRSVIDTSIKNAQNVMETLAIIPMLYKAE